jgi:hypothetical protein
MVRSKSARRVTMAKMTYTKVSLNFGLGTPDGVVVDEGVGVEDANEMYIDEKIDVAVGMVLLRPAEELPAAFDMSVEKVEETDGTDGTLVASGYTVVYCVTMIRE